MVQRYIVLAVLTMHRIGVVRQSEPQMANIPPSKITGGVTFIPYLTGKEVTVFLMPGHAQCRTCQVSSVAANTY